MATNLSLRYSFNVPTVHTGRKGKRMLSGFALQHVALCNRVDADEFFDTKDALFPEFGGDINKLALVWMKGAEKRIQKEFKLTDEEATLIKFRGISSCRHEAGEKVEANDPRWV